jgi:hypothetical protein
MKTELTKRLKKMVRDLADIAHERKMRTLLTPLTDTFSQWKAGKIDTWDFLGELDRFETARHRLTKQYRTRGIEHMLVACNIVTGILRKNEVAPDLMSVLEKPMRFYEDGLRDGTVSLEEDEQ